MVVNVVDKVIEIVELAVDVVLVVLLILFSDVCEVGGASISEQRNLNHQQNTQIPNIIWY